MLLVYLKESFKLFFRAKLSSVLSLISTTIAVSLILVSFVLFISSEKLENYLKENISIGIFIKDSVQKSELSSIEDQLKVAPYVKKIRFISKEQAVDIFVKETGEDFSKILDYNPLPASFIINIKSDYGEKDSLKNIIASLNNFSWIEEVVYKDNIIQKFLSYLKKIRVYVFAVTGIILLISLYLVYSTVRLIINSMMNEFETMKLVGAKLSTIKFPIILNSFIVGLLAGAGAFGIYSLIVFYAGNYISIPKVFQFDEIQLILILFFSGPLIASLVTMFSLRRVTLKVKA